MAPALKVFRTPIGFHDAYVAAPSQKAALEAWGADANLFARGAAERVTDPALTAEPLAHPGTVIKKSRASAAEHFASLGQAKKAAWSKGKKPSPSKAPHPPRPRPSRAAVDAAELALAEHQRQAAANLAVLEREQRRIAAEVARLEARLAKEAERLERQLTRARRSHEAALERWRAS